MSKVCCFSNLNEHMNYLEILLNCRFWLSVSCGLLKIFISNKFSGVAHADDPWATLRVAKM